MKKHLVLALFLVAGSVAANAQTRTTTTTQQTTTTPAQTTTPAPVMTQPTPATTTETTTTTVESTTTGGGTGLQSSTGVTQGTVVPATDDVKIKDKRRKSKAKN